MTGSMKSHYTNDKYSIKSELVDIMEHPILFQLFMIFIICDFVICGIILCYEPIFIIYFVPIICIEIVIWIILNYIYPPSAGMIIYIISTGSFREYDRIISRYKYRYHDGGKIDAENIAIIIESYKKDIDNRIKEDIISRKYKDDNQKKLEKHQNDLKYKHENVLYMVDSKLKNEELK